MAFFDPFMVGEGQYFMETEFAIPEIYRIDPKIYVCPKCGRHGKIGSGSYSQFYQVGLWNDPATLIIKCSSCNSVAGEFALKGNNFVKKEIHQTSIAEELSEDERRKRAALR